MDVERRAVSANGDIITLSLNEFDLLDDYVMRGSGIRERMYSVA
jgi:hypothetical protein